MSATVALHWMLHHAGPWPAMGVRLALQSTLILSVGLLWAAMVRRRSAVTESLVLRGTLLSVLVCPVATALLHLAAREWVMPQSVTAHRWLQHLVAVRLDDFAIAATLVAVCCSAVSLLLLARMVVGLRFLRTVRQRASSASYGWIEDSGRCARALGVTPPPVLATQHFSAPCLLGFRKPVILLPVDATTVRHDVLLHELAHVRRRDFLWQLFSVVITSLLWWQPLMWALAYRLRYCADAACDDFVVAYGSSRSDYASALVDMASAQKRTRASQYSVGLVSFKSALSGRVVRIMDTSRAISLRTSPLVAAMVVLLLFAEVLFLSVAGNATIARADDAHPPTPPKKQPTSIFDFGLDPLPEKDPAKGDKEPAESPAPALPTVPTPAPNTSKVPPTADAQAQAKQAADAVRVSAEGVITTNKVIRLALRGTEEQHFIVTGDLFAANDSSEYGNIVFYLRETTSRQRITLGINGMLCKRLMVEGKTGKFVWPFKFEGIEHQKWYPFTIDASAEQITVRIGDKQGVAKGPLATAGSNSISLGPGAQLRNLKIAIFQSATPGAIASAPAPAATAPPPTAHPAAPTPWASELKPPAAAPPIGSFETIVSESAQINMNGYEPEPLAPREDKRHGFSAIPPIFHRYPAIAYSKAMKNYTGIADFEVTASGYLLLVCDYGYQGNDSGGWIESRLKPEDFVARGWKIVEDSTLGGKFVSNSSKNGGHEIVFVKHVEKGEKYNLRCNKSDPPFPIVFLPPNSSITAPPQAAPAAGPVAPVDVPAKLEPGLVAYEYAALPGEEDTGAKGVDFSQFANPVGPPQVAASLHPWQWQGNRNASVHGQLWVEVPGHYSIQSMAWCGRRYLFLDGKLLSEFGNDNCIQELELTKGYHDIAVIGAVTKSPNVNVNWRPPGAPKLVPLPDAALFHDRAATSPPKLSSLHAIPVANTPPAINPPTALPPPAAPTAPVQPQFDLPKSPQAIAALDREAVAIKHAGDAYHQSAVASVQACAKDLDAALKLATQSGNLDEANRIVAAKKLVMSNLDQLEGKPRPEGLPTPAASSHSARPSGPAYYACVMGRYYATQDWKKPHPYINMSVPASNLWSEAIKSQLRGKVDFTEIAWRGFAQLIIPHDGTYRIEAKDCWMKLNDKQVDSGDIQLKRGAYKVELTTSNHGQPHIDHAQIRVIDTQTQAVIPLVNSEADVKAFLATGGGDQPVREVSGWKPGPDNLVVIRR